MAVIIRLRQLGKKNRHSFRLVVTSRQSPRDGKYIEKLGWYNPHEKEEKSTHIEKERIEYWLDKGALISEKAKALVLKKAPEVIKKLQDKKVNKRISSRKKKKKWISSRKKKKK